MTTPSEPSLVQLWLHGGLDLSEQLQKEPPECPAENVSAHPTPHRDRTLVEQGVHRSLRLYNALAGLLFLGCALFQAQAVACHGVVQVVELFLCRLPLGLIFIQSGLGSLDALLCRQELAF